LNLFDPCIAKQDGRWDTADDCILARWWPEGQP
jgi:hypothetical protein